MCCILVLRVTEIKPPELIGSEFIFSSCQNLPYDVVAKDDLKVLIIPKEALLAALMNNKELLLNFFNTISCAMVEQTNRIKDLGLNTLKGRIANYLLLESGKCKSDIIVLNDIQTELAELFGVARPSVSRIFKEMDKEGLIDLSKKSVEILDREGLECLFN